MAYSTPTYVTSMRENPCAPGELVRCIPIDRVDPVSPVTATPLPSFPNV